MNRAKTTIIAKGRIILPMTVLPRPTNSQTEHETQHYLSSIKSIEKKPLRLPKSNNHRYYFTMDLGFGDRNHEIGQATAGALMQGAEAQMQGLDREMAQYDRLLDDEVSPLGNDQS